jgi:uncharacterized membrane protein YsdA (DUF1294 family)
MDGAFGFSRLMADVAGGNHGILFAYLVIVNLLTLVLFIMDKVKAIGQRPRIREFNLLLPSFLGGALGGLLGMMIGHHKTRSATFVYSMPVMLVVDVVVAFLVRAGVA